MTPDDDSLTDLIRTLENERYAAMIAGDAGELDRLLSDRLVYGHSNAERDSKDSYLGLRAAPCPVYSFFTLRNQQGEGAMAVCGARMTDCL